MFAAGSKMIKKGHHLFHLACCLNIGLKYIIKRIKVPDQLESGHNLQFLLFYKSREELIK